MRAENRSAVLAAAACAIAAFVAIGVIRGRDAEPGPSHGTRLVFSTNGDTRAAGRAVEVVRDRVESKGEDGAVVVVRGTDVVVEIADRDQEIVAAVADVVARIAHLELVIVDDGNPIMAQVGAATDSDPDAMTSHTHSDVDAWTSEDGVRHTDTYLRAEDGAVPGRQAIENRVAMVTASDTAMALPPDRQVACQRFDSTADAPAYWRSYLLDTTRKVSGAIISDASMTYDPQTGRPLVIVELSRAGGEAFADLTRANVGRKLAVVVDGKVKSAPIINGAITGGRISITMGGSDQVAQEHEALDLVAVLKAGSLPTPLTLERITPFDRPGGGFLARSWMFFALAGVLAIGLALWLVRSRTPG